MPGFSRLRDLWQRRPWAEPVRFPEPTWPDDGSWISTAEPCAAFQLDAGYAVTSHVPGWMLPVGAANDRPISLPDLPQVVGHVLTAEAVGREAELIRHFGQLPPLPDRALRGEGISFKSLEVDLLLCVPDQWPILVDTFGGGRHAPCTTTSTRAGRCAS